MKLISSYTHAWRLVLLAILTAYSGCQPETRHTLSDDAEWQHKCMSRLTDVIVHDIFSPPVSSRIYAYASLAYLEGLNTTGSTSHSLLPDLKGFDRPILPKGKDSIHARLSATIAFIRVSKALVFSKDSLNDLETAAMSLADALPEGVKKRSMAWAENVAGTILKRASQDNYKQTRSMPRYSVFGEPGKWQQTPPDYTDATEPHWKLIRCLRMDSASQCSPPPPPPYSADLNSVYDKELREVWKLSKERTPEMDTIARFWDDNPFVSEHVGHLTYATKKMTPVGHWISIVGILCGKVQHDELSTARIYALTAAAVFDAFISCWDEKYRSVTVRPVTVIREKFDPTWSPFLQTPPFPEYTSGHSVITAAAATVLTSVFGPDVAFTDTTEMPYLGIERSFPSIEAAANEAGISRLYGGIHFRSAIEQGKQQGEKVGSLFLPLIR